ncbi:hypothetical protein [Nitrobacter winogradskyi]|uniref:Uncharacterized protein n=2 Tax=Nitrobacter winogradskyi TaxID=913 RepID=A0ACC6AJM1_NITWI|nr:hypothetical protein [Nitrobacter winogradskyi]MCP2000068.1 hypothetical protein [Nitrobacter winogradskyi]GEC15706.1 hypothetical protein NWI01_15980 [Nitrobacter winogradskyi]
MTCSPQDNATGNDVLEHDPIHLDQTMLRIRLPPGNEYLQHGALQLRSRSAARDEHERPMIFFARVKFDSRVTLRLDVARYSDI